MSDTATTQAQGIRVFAYGSNMSTARMLARAPGAAVIGVGRVAGRSLCFHKRSIDGSAKANALASNSEAHEVWGVVYRLNVAEKRALDGYEALGVSYDECEVQVEISGSATVASAWIYEARTEKIFSNLLPYDWYHAFVLAGAIEHGLPPDYVAALRELGFAVDPDEERRRKNLALLGR